MNEADNTSRSGFQYQRVLLKLSGEALMGPSGFGIDMGKCTQFAQGISK